MMKKSILIILLALLNGALWAYDFSATVPSGQTLYFDYVEGGVAVVHPKATNIGYDSWGAYDKPSGSMTIPSFVSDGNSSYAVLSVGRNCFHSCSNLTEVYVSEGIVKVDTGAFYGCLNTVGVHLPASLEEIESSAFAYMSALADVWIATLAVPATNNNAFFGTDLEQCTLHVGCSMVGAYSEADVWQGFGQIVASACQVMINTTVNNSLYGSVSGGGVYEVGTAITLIAMALDGYSFVCWNDGSVLNPRIVNATTDSSFMAIFFATSFGGAVPSADTVYVAVPVHDTLVIYDTLYVAVPIYDTVIQHDTLYVALPIHDTISVHDTLYVAVPTHDTVYHTDTLYVNTTVHDTVMPTFFTLTVLSDNEGMGVGVGSALLPAGVEAELCGLPIEGHRFVSWDDGSTANPRRITITGATTMRALFEKVGIGMVAEVGWHATAVGRRIQVDGVAAQQVSLYDMQGRRLFVHRSNTDTLVLEVPATGVYLVQVGQGAACRVVVQ